jgi:hypothetical protein
MKTSPTTPRTSRKTTSTVAKTTPAGKKVTAPRVRRAAPKKKAPADAVPAAGVLSPDEVRFRAYEIYLRRNGHGDELSDWLQAEQELTAHAG